MLLLRPSPTGSAPQQEAEIHRQPLQSTRSGPPQHDQNESPPRAHYIQQPTANRIHQRVWNEKRKLQPRELLIAQRYRSLDRRDRHRQRLPVEVADSNRCRYQRDKIPPRLD
jgi:hypothetical protein